MTSAEARALRRPLRAPEFIALRRGVWASARELRHLPPWQRYAARVHALLLTHPDVVLSHESAAIVHGLPLFGQPRALHVFDAERTASRRFGDVSVHTSLDERAIERIGGIRVTSLVDTVIDLARVLPPAQAVAVTDAAIAASQGGSLSLGELRAKAVAQQSRRGSRQLDWVWGESDDRAESAPESISRVVMGWAGFERPELQRSFHLEGATDRPDFFFPSAAAIGESDGWGKYELHDADAAANRLREEKRREDRLRRAGLAVARWELADALRVDPMARALRAAGVSQLRPADRAGLATLRRSPRTLTSGR